MGLRPHQKELIKNIRQGWKKGLGRAVVIHIVGICKDRVKFPGAKNLKVMITSERINEPIGKLVIRPSIENFKKC